MKKQKVSLKKLCLSKSKIATLGTNRILGGGTLVCFTDGDECKPKKSVYPDICPQTTGCPPATLDCNSFVCPSVVCVSLVCASRLTC